ncbi:unnamed protein product [Owenia fusiformis]|uniref:Uncharacterized protein n=1 Tax=Owenia fusiformis TaxID=6347 RepID=A0A8J1UGH7_OWEFU|nr:unnamed protein product [Owenia fusiformis]
MAEKEDCERKKVTFTESQIKDYKSTFNLFDSDNSGTIDLMELGDLLRGIGQNPSNKEVEELIKKHDVNQNGRMEFDEFLELMSVTVKPEEEVEDELRQAFKVFDKDGNGYISAKEMLVVLTKMGEEMSMEEVEEYIIKPCDVDGDGRINYEEFVEKFMGTS